MCIDTKSLEESLKGAIRICMEDGLRAGNGFIPDLKPLVLSSKHLDQVLEIIVRSMVEKDIEPDVTAGTTRSAALVGAMLTTSSVFRGFLIRKDEENNGYVEAGDIERGDRVAIVVEDISNANYAEIKLIIERIKNCEAEHLATVVLLNMGIDGQL